MRSAVLYPSTVAEFSVEGANPGVAPLEKTQQKLGVVRALFVVLVMFLCKIC